MFGFNKKNSIIKTTDRRTYFGKQSSDNIIKDTNGQLVCMNVPIARTGKQEYYGMELSPDLEQNQLYVVERLPEDVFSKEFIASFENTPFTNLHPSMDVIVGQNHKELSKGFVKDVRPGHLEVRGLDKKYYSPEGYNVLYADIVVTDADAIAFIESELKKPFNERKIDVSCGYDAEYIQTGDYSFRQIGKNGNHVALVPQGRAGIAKIRDEAASIVIEHNNEYFKKSLPFGFEGGLKKLGITKYELKTMTAEEYFDELVNGVKTHFEAEVIPSDEEVVNNIIKFVFKGNLLDLPFVLYNSTDEGTNDQDGRHRVQAMSNMGIKDIPVLFFYKTKHMMKANDSISITIGGHVFESNTIDNEEELKEIAISVIAEMENDMKFKITKDSDGSYEVETKDANTNDLYFGFNLSQALKNKDFKEIEKHKKELEGDVRAWGRALSKAKPDSDDKAKYEDLIKNANADIAQLNRALKQKTKDSKPYRITVKDHIYTMDGFDSKAQAKEYALMIYESVKDKKFTKKWSNEAVKTYEKHLKSLEKELSDYNKEADSETKRHRKVWERIYPKLEQMRKDKLTRTNEYKTLSRELDESNAKKSLVTGRYRNKRIIQDEIDTAKEDLRYWKEMERKMTSIIKKLERATSLEEIRKSVSGTEWEYNKSDVIPRGEGYSILLRGPGDIYVQFYKNRVSKITN